MELEIRKLTPDMAETYIHFFDTTPHDDGDPEHTCYCVNWCTANQTGRAPFIPRQERKALAEQYVANGALQGYLAFWDGKPVGWCNANEKTSCLTCVGWTYFMTEINQLPITAEKVKSIFCFVIAPEMKRKGVATALLRRICEDARAEGYDAVEAYPQKCETDELMFYVGHQGLYEKLGFEVYAETETKRVLRKRL